MTTLTLNILCAGAVQGIVKSLQARFEQDTGATLQTRFESDLMPAARVAPQHPAV